MYFAVFYLVTINLLFLKINQIYGTGQFYKSEANKTYYIDFEQKFTWFDGQYSCTKLNMTLLEVKTENKSLEITKLIQNVPKKTFGGYLWTGGIRTQIENDDFFWISTGEEFNYTNWYPNNPDFTEDDEFCVELVEIRNWQWNDLYCKRKRGFVCEYKPATGDIQQEIKKLKETLKQQDSKQEKQQKLIDILKQMKENEPEKLLKISQLQNNIKEMLQVGNENNLKINKDIESFAKTASQTNGKNNIHVYSPYTMFFNSF